MQSEMRQYAAAPGLRIVSGFIGAVSALAAAGELASAVIHPTPLAILAVLVFGLPSLPAAVVLRRSINVEQDALISRGLFGARRIGWLRIQRVDVRRGAFSIETESGPISTALVDPRDRDNLLRTTVERAGLTRDLSDLPWGIDARFVQRREDIRFIDFVPHNKRSGKREP